MHRRDTGTEPCCATQMITSGPDIVLIYLPGRTFWPSVPSLTQRYIVETLLLQLIPFKGLLTDSTVRRPAAKWPCDDWLWAGLQPPCGSAANRKFPLLCLSERKMSVCHPRCLSASLSNTHRDSAARCFTQAGSAAHIPFPTAARSRMGI